MNYASFDASALDVMMGTYMGSFGEARSASVRAPAPSSIISPDSAGNQRAAAGDGRGIDGHAPATSSVRGGLAAIPDAKAVVGVPSPAVAAYMIGVLICIVPWVLASAHLHPGGYYSPLQAYAVGVAAGFGPIALAYVIPSAKGSNNTTSDGARGLGLTLSWVMWILGAASSGLPVMCACAWCLL